MKNIKLFCLTIILQGLLSFSIHAQTNGFAVPPGHPRLFFNAERLSLAQTWYASHPFTPATNDRLGNAFRYLLTGEANYARTAINWLMALQFPAGQVLPDAIGSDYSRWHGEEAVLIYDWCYSQMTPLEREIIIDRYNNYFSNINQHYWGGVGMEGNNYYWGNLRNSLEWGIASFHENAQAQSFLNNALNTRFTNSFIPYATNNSALGGALPEGPEYGCTMLSYPIIPFVTTDFLGRDLFNETNFFRETLINTIYSTTSSPRITANGTHYGFFPQNETAINDILHEREYWGDFMTTMANKWHNISLGQYAKHWLNLTTSRTANYIKSVDAVTIAKDFSDLPYDYYAPGLGNLYARNNWTANATALQFQLKNATGVGHSHDDWGTFQIFRKGRFLTRESYGYSHQILGVNNETLDVLNPDAHNSIFVGIPDNMKGLVGRDWQTAPPTVTRLESNEYYVYAAVDMTDCYQSEDQPVYFYNPFTADVVREFLFIRPMETLIVFDRIKSKSDQVPAAQVDKMALVHFETLPTILNANNVLATIGNQEIQVTTLVPSNPSYAVINEGGTRGQYRLQITTDGNEQSYFVNVFHMRDTSDAALTTNITETADKFDISLSHPILGEAVIQLKKGSKSTGGSFAYSLLGNLQVNNTLLDRVQQISVDNDGPHWEDLTLSTPDDAKHTNENIQAYPNPAMDVINIVISPTAMQEARGNSEIQISNTLGQSVYNSTCNMQHATLEIDVSQLTPGLYFIKLINQKKTYTQKFIKQKK